jgi:coenzyme Q-binding protein COQ10
MPQFTTHRHVAHTAAQMFDLVADLESYPQFVPLCEALTVRHREVIDGKPVFIADMTVGYKAINETFTSRVTLDRPAASILVEYVDGPFHHLENIWRFEDIDRGSLVHFHIAYEFKSAMLGMLMGGLFDKAFRKFTHAFENRARQVYGTEMTSVTPGWLSGAYRN